MDEQAVEQYLLGAVELALESDEDDSSGLRESGPLSESGFLTRDKGLHLTFEDGSEWKVSVHCYRRPREEKEGE